MEEAEVIVTTPDTKEFLPEASVALTYSIVGNALSLLFAIPILGILCCIAGLILSIIGLRKGKSGMDLWKFNKQKYQGGSFVKTLIAFILGIIGIVQAGILTIYAIFFSFIILGTGFHHL